MKNEEIKENEEIVEVEEKQEETQMLSVQDFSAMRKNTNTQNKIFTNITDQKKIFNLENSCDFRINDCKGEKIRVKEVLIKVIEKPLETPEINEETGEITKDKEVKMITILIDDNDKSYVTGSKSFTIQFSRYIEMFGLQSIENGLEIEITERTIKNSPNKVLAFELV